MNSVFHQNKFYTQRWKQNNLNHGLNDELQSFYLGLRHRGKKFLFSVNTQRKTEGLASSDCQGIGSRLSTSDIVCQWFIWVFPWAANRREQQILKIMNKNAKTFFAC